MLSKKTPARVLSSQLKDYLGKEVTLRGWLHKKRVLGGMTFLVLRDRHGLVQVLDEKSSEASKLEGLYTGTVLTVSGTVVADERAIGGVEIHGPELTIEVPVEFVSPIEIDKAIDHTPDNLDTLFENRVVGLRNIAEQGIFRVQAAVKQAVREYLMGQDFIEFNSPKLISGSTEGGAEVFELDYFGKKATLAQSAQFYKQIMAGVFERAFEINPTYRAEPSVTTRHMTEFMHIDGEIAFIDSIEELVSLLSGMINFVTEEVWSKREKELLALGATKPVLTKIFPQITMRELHRLYFEKTGDDTRDEKDPTPAEERWISEYSKAEWGSEAVFITEFPAGQEMGMKFYHHRNDQNPTVTDRSDLIFRGVEISTTTIREHRYPKLLEQMKEFGIDSEHPGFKYYLQAFKYGMPPHGGFGMGLERLTQKIVGLNNVKEASLFPRDTSRLAP